MWLPQGKASKDIEQLLGYVGSEEVIHRDNIGLTTLMERNRPANRPRQRRPRRRVADPAAAAVIRPLAAPTTWRVWTL